MDNFDINDILNAGGKKNPKDYDRSFHIGRPSGDVIGTPFGTIRQVDPRPSQMGVGEMIRLCNRIKNDYPDLKVTQYEVGCGSGLLGRSVHAVGHITLASGAQVFVDGSFLNADEYDRWHTDVQAAISEQPAAD